MNMAAMPARINHIVRAALPFRLSLPALVAGLNLLMLGCGRSDAPGRQVVQADEERGAHSNLPLLTDVHGIEHHPFQGSDAIANVLVFTLQDCPIANSYIPTLNKLVDDYGPRGIRLLLVHVDPELTIEEARRHSEEYHIKAPVVVDRKHAWVNFAGATRSPEVAAFSPAGEVLYTGRIDDKYAALGKRRTHISAHDLRDALDAILAGRPVPHPKTEAVGCFIPPLSPGD
jgi:hypothetical protein